MLFAWPDVHTDWAPQLNAAQQTYLSIFDALLHYSDVVLVCLESRIHELRERFKTQFGGHPFAIYLFCADYNDTWARDFGPITIEDDKSRSVLNFTFDGWGGKFNSELDNGITSKLISGSVFSVNTENVDLVLEGGGIESNGRFTLLTTSACLLNKNRNQNISSESKKSVIERTLRDTLGTPQILWLDHGHLIGDDTDSHIDTLARFAPDNTIVYVSCDEREDEHFESLKNMRRQLNAFTLLSNEAFNLIPVPLPSPIYNQAGERLPATYANFLVCNGAVLAPTYKDAKDDHALSQLQKAFPKHQVIGVDCRALIEQHGSLHCITMQLIKNTVSFDQLDKV